MIDIGKRLELFVDEFLIQELRGVRRVLHEPTPREVVVVHDEPWEGSGCGYHALFRDGPVCRMYYHAWNLSLVEGKLQPSHGPFGAYAESDDGLHWRKPRLGLVEFAGSKENNLICAGPAGHDFKAFRDDNPACDPRARYKAVASGGKCAGAKDWHDGQLLAFQSPDGVRFSPLGDGPILTGLPFDTENIAFWDAVRGQYRAYVRNFFEHQGQRVRGIMTCTSSDFLHWTEPVWLVYPGSPVEQLYTNQVQPYYRAPHLFVGFPARYVERGWGPSLEALPGVEHRRMRSAASKRYGTAVTDGLFMASRDGRVFHRWNEVFLRPGLKTAGNWAYGDNYIAWGMIETPSHADPAVPELSLYATENYWIGPASRLRRYTLRIDGFVSMHADGGGGEFLTRPLTFAGRELCVNFSTSAAGSLRVEVQDETGRPLEGFSLSDCDELFGDDLERVVTWKGGRDLSALAGRPVRLRFSLRDADLYSIRFR